MRGSNEEIVFDAGDLLQEAAPAGVDSGVCRTTQIELPAEQPLPAMPVLRPVVLGTPVVNPLLGIETDEGTSQPQEVPSAQYWEGVKNRYERLKKYRSSVMRLWTRAQGEFPNLKRYAVLAAATLFVLWLVYQLGRIGAYHDGMQTILNALARRI